MSLLEGNLCAEQEVVLIGAGNSAGQATVLSGQQGREGVVLESGSDLEPACRAIWSIGSRVSGNVEVPHAHVADRA